MKIQRTAFGKYCQSLRELEKLSLYKYAAEIGYAPSFVCSVETGRKKVPAGFLSKVSDLFNLTDKEKYRLEERELNSRGAFNIEARTNGEAVLLAAFLQNRDRLDEKTLTDVTKILKGKKTNRENCEDEKS